MPIAEHAAAGHPRQQKSKTARIAIENSELVFRHLLALHKVLGNDYSEKKV